MSSADPCEQRLGRLTSISKPSFSHCKAVNGKGSRTDTCISEQHHQTFRHASSSARIVGTLPATRTRAHQDGDFELLTAVRVRVLPVKPLSRPDRVPHHADANRETYLVPIYGAWCRTVVQYRLYGAHTHALPTG